MSAKPAGEDALHASWRSSVPGRGKAPTVAPLRSQPQPTTAAFSMTVGRLVARQVEMRLRQAAHGLVDITIEKHMSLFQGVLLVTIKGDSDPVQRYLRAVQEWQP